MTILPRHPGQWCTFRKSSLTGQWQFSRIVIDRSMTFSLWTRLWPFVIDCSQWHQKLWTFVIGHMSMPKKLSLTAGQWQKNCHWLDVLYVWIYVLRMSLRMICFQIKYLVQYGWNGSSGLMKRKKGGSRVEEILKRRAIGEWLGCGWGEMAAEILKREKWSRNKGIVCLRSPTT